MKTKVRQQKATPGAEQQKATPGAEQQKAAPGAEQQKATPGGKPPKDLPFWGADLNPEARPGVPRESAPHPMGGAHWREPPRQPVQGEPQTRVGLSRPTPVFSTALPPRGLSGMVRRAAHRIPDHRVAHWMLLLLADRIDAVESLPRLSPGALLDMLRRR